jgi:hypothetical protein
MERGKAGQQLQARGGLGYEVQGHHGDPRLVAEELAA